jgi:hypothetical protein
MAFSSDGEGSFALVEPQQGEHCPYSSAAVTEERLNCPLSLGSFLVRQISYGDFALRRRKKTRSQLQVVVADFS